MTNPTFVEDYNAIVDVLNKYNGGCAKADSSIMKPAFSDHATIFGIDNGKLSGGPIEALFKAIDTAFRPSPEAKAAIERIDIVGTAASARVDTDNVSGYLTELAERAERRRLLREELDRYQAEFGAFTDDEMTEARALLHGTEETERAA